MVSVSNMLLQKCFDLYDISSLYSNYSNIAYKYYKSYKEIKTKKIFQENSDKLKEDVKKWFFSQSLESRLKICTVENEFFGKILYQMIFHYILDRTINFKPKDCFFSGEGENSNEQFSKNISCINNLNNLNNFNKSEETKIKITKTNKNGKRTEAPKLGYSQSSSINSFNNDEILQNNFGNFFTFFSSRGNYTLASSNNMYSKINSDRVKMIENATDDFLKNIYFFSVYHKYFPDCFTLSPELLLEKEKFENYFSMLGNKNYFSCLIQSHSINNTNNNINSKNQKIYGYKFPDWMIGTKNIPDIHLTVAQYAIAFFEQVIMIKYLLNKNEKKIKFFSLLNDDILNRFFTDRKNAIQYFYKNYTQENKINILTELNIDEHYKKVMTNHDKMKYVNYFNLYRKNIDAEKSPYIDSININPHSNKYEEQYNKLNKITKPKNVKNNKNINSDLTFEEIYEKIKNNLINKDNICFIDYLLFDNYINLWKTEYFIKGELLEKMNKLIIDKNVNELLINNNSSQTKSNKSKHRKKKKNNNNKKEEEKNNNSSNNNNNENNEIKNEYEGIFKDEEEIIYAPYYLKANTEQKKLYNKIKEQKININKYNKETEEIKNFISNDIIKGLLIERIFLTPLNTCLDFYEQFKEEEKITEKNEILNEEEKKEEKKEEEKEENKINDEDVKEIKTEKEEKEKEEEKDIDNIEDELDLKKSESMSITTQDTNNINININLDLQKAKSTEFKSDKKNENENYDNNKSNNNSNNNSSNKNSSKKEKKNKKKQNFFLFDTVKKKKEKSNSLISNNTLVSNEFSIIQLKEPNTRLSFFDKLHNDIIKYETKVITLLNHGMKFKDFCITEIKRLIQETLNFSNDYSIEVYGSYATGLMIEASDIDIKIKLNKASKTDLNSFFKKVCEKLENENKFDEINPIETASVPVIKLLLSKEKFIKGKTELENGYKQFKEMSLFKHYLFNMDELTKIKIDVTFILSNDISNNKNIKEEINNINIENNINKLHDHDKSMESEISSVSYVKEQIVKYPEIKFILRVLKRYFYYKKMNTAFLGGLSSYNLFLLLLSYAKFLKISENPEKTNLGYFLFHFLYFFKIFDFKQYIININSENNIYDLLPPEKAKEFNFGKSIVIIDPLTGVNASKSSYKIEDIQNTFSEAFDFFQDEEIRYDKEGKTKINKKNNKNEKKILMGLPISNKNENNHAQGNIIEKFLGK